MTTDNETNACATKADKQSPITHFGDKIMTWQPGESGNPLGRPKKDACITSLVKDILDKKDKTGKTYAMLIAEAMVKQALKDPQILKELLNRTEGKVVDSVDIQGTHVTITYELTKREDD